MDSSAAVFTSIGFLCIVSLGLAYRFLSRFCRREEVTVSSSNRHLGSADSTLKGVQVATATPQLYSYKKRRFLASMPSLDHFLCNTLSWQEGVTLESGLGNLSSEHQSRDRANTAPARQPGDKDNNGEGINNNNDILKGDNGGPDINSHPSGSTSASTQTSGVQPNNCTRSLAHSILNIVSAIPNISLGSFSHSQSLPNVNGYLTESVSTCTGSRDLVVLWSTTLESVNSDILTSTRVE